LTNLLFELIGTIPKTLHVLFLSLPRFACMHSVALSTASKQDTKRSEYLSTQKVSAWQDQYQSTQITIDIAHSSSHYFRWDYETHTQKIRWVTATSLLTWKSSG